MNVIGYHINSSGAFTSEGEYCGKPPYLDFLLEPKPEVIRVFYHMSYNIANLLKLANVTKPEGSTLQDTTKLRLDSYTLKHIAGKFFSIKKGIYYGSPFANFSDMNQYKPAVLEINETPETCVAKAKEAQKTGEEVYNALVELGLHPKSLTSPIKSYEREILSRMNLPTIDDMPEEAGYYAYNCCSGNWLEAFQLGHWEQAWDYDINSAYPAELAKLLDIRLGKWVESDQWVPEAKYGYCKGTVTINSPLSPIIYTKKGSGFDSLNYTAVGSWETFLTTEQIKFIYEWKLGKFEVENGWWWVPAKEQRVLDSIIEQLYWVKEASTGLQKEITKRVMSGIWGKFLAVQGNGFGDRFNPVYGAEVETRCRLKVAALALQHPKNIVHIAVDGLVADKPIMPNIAAEQEQGMGYWKQTAESPMPCIVVGTGTVAVRGKEKTGDFSLDYNWLIKQIKENPEEKEYKTEKLAPVTLAVALNGDWEKLGELRKITKTVRIGSDIKRCYREQPKNGQELLDKKYGSEPWDISIIRDDYSEVTQ